ncbi:MAG: PEGA domain-containing protein [Desulfobacterales bacterium]
MIKAATMTGDETASNLVCRMDARPKPGCRVRAHAARLALTLLLALCWLMPWQAQATSRGVVVVEDENGEEVPLYNESHALLVGVSDYTGGWPKLPGVPGDLDAVKAVLEKHGFQVEVVRDPDHAALESAYQDFIYQYGLDPNNRLLFYFAGHGYTFKPAYAGDDPEDWLGYIVSREAPLPSTDGDTMGKFLQATISMQRFGEWAQQIQSKHALFLFDSCFSGSVFALNRAPPSNISEKTTEPVRQFITSGSADQEVPDTSIFRRQFVAALDGAADLTGDGYVTGQELGIFLEDTVTNYSHGAQTPRHGKLRHPTLDKGDFVFMAGDFEASAAPSDDVSAPPPPPPAPVDFIGYLQVNVNVLATVFIDDHEAGTARPGAPLELSGLNTGPVEVRVEADGFETENRSATVEVGKWTQLVIQMQPLKPKTASLTVRSNVPDDTLYVDGKSFGPTGPTPHELPPGKYTLRVAKTGYTTWSEVVVLAAGQSRTLHATLKQRVERVAAPADPMRARLEKILTESAREKVQRQAAGTGDWLYIRNARPASGEVFPYGKNVEFTLEIVYNLKSAKRARLVVSVGQLPVTKDGCQASSGNLVDYDDTIINAGNGRAAVKVTWKGGASSKRKQTDGFLAFYPSIWQTEGHNFIAGFGRSPGYCYGFYKQ